MSFTQQSFALPLALAVALGAGHAASTALAQEPSAAPTGPTTPAGEDTAASLGEHVRAIRAAHDGGDHERAAALTRALIPSAEELAALFAPDADPAISAKIEQGLALPPDAPANMVGKLLAPPGRTEVVVHAATVAELRAYAAGSPAAREFPGGAQKVAVHLQPEGRRLYEVVLREPGKELGSRFHLFFWTPKGWRMLGPAWRALPR